MTLVCAALACSDGKPSGEVTATSEAVQEASAAPSASASASAQAAIVDRSPIKTSPSKDRLVLTATKFELERMEDRLQMWMGDPRALNLHPLRGAMFVTYAGIIWQLDGHTLAPKKGIFPEEAYTVLSIVGSHPDAMLTRVYFDSWKSPGYQRSAPVKETQVRSYSGGELGRATGDRPLKVAGWKAGTAVGLDQGTLVMAAGNGSAPKQQPPRDGAGCKDVQIAGEEVDALPTGEIFVLGKHCGQGAHAIELFDAAGTSKIEELPQAPAAAKRGFVAASSAKSAFVALSTGELAYFARWDGAAFRKLEVEASGDVSSVWATPDGALFFILLQKGKAELWRVMPSGEVKKSGVFAPSPNAMVWASDAETAFVPSFQSVLSTKPGLTFSGYVAEKPGEDPGAALSPPRTGLPRFTDACTTPFVFLFDVVDSSGPTFDFPNTRGALKLFPKLSDLKLVEIKVGSGRKLGVVVPSKEVGEQLIEHVKKHMKDENPGLACYQPKDDARTIDLK